MHSPALLRLLFVINPISGGKTKTDWETTIREYFKEKDHTTEFFLLTGKNDEGSISQHIRLFRPDRLIGVGGDGTIKMLADLVKNTGLPLGILPAGSANGMARELCIPTEKNEALDVTLNGCINKLDAITVNGELCIHLSDIGLNAMLVKGFENSAKRGMWGYIQSVASVLWRKQKMQVTIDTGKEKIQRSTYMVIIANARTYGTGAVINPDGKLDDGCFEIVVLRKLNLFKIFKMIIINQAAGKDHVEIWKAEEAELSTKRKAYLQVDGEYIGKRTNIQVKMLPQAINIIVPAIEELA